jgi:hypothetical protein
LKQILVLVIAVSNLFNIVLDNKLLNLELHLSDGN